MEFDRKTLIIIGSLLGAVVIFMAILGIIQQVNSTPDQTDSSVYVDPGSGETVIRNDKAPHGSELSLRNSTIYLGFSRLLERGLSAEEIQNIQSTINRYSLEQSEKFEEVSLTVDSMKYATSANDPSSYMLTFDITVNRKTNYFVTVDPKTDMTHTVKLYDSNRETLLIEG